MHLGYRSLTGEVPAYVRGSAPRHERPIREERHPRRIARIAHGYHQPRSGRPANCLRESISSRIPWHTDNGDLNWPIEQRFGDSEARTAGPWRLCQRDYDTERTLRRLPQINVTGEGRLRKQRAGRHEPT